MKESTKFDPRGSALDTIIDVCEKGEYLGRLLSSILSKASGADKRDRALYTRIVCGTVERLLTIDSVIDSYSSRPVRKQKPVIRSVLRMSVFQILYMDHIPDRAACNEAVKLVSKRHMSGLGGFVNGVLRQIVREKEAGKLDYILSPDLDKADNKKRATLLSVPEWILEEYDKVFGKTKSTEAMLSMFERGGTASLRANTLGCDPDGLWNSMEEAGVNVERTRLPYAAVISGFDKIEALPGYERGDFYVQDLSSIEAIASAGIKEGERILDMCASPGGKSFGARMLSGDGGSVISCDVSEQKVSDIRENMSRLGLGGIMAVCHDATEHNSDWDGGFDLVICDLPCSGLGTFAKKPELRYRVIPSDIKELAALQKQILDVAANYVKPGGRLMFSTCTITKAENMDNRERFLKDHPEFSPGDERLIVPDIRHDGFYYSMFLRK